VAILSESRISEGHILLHINDIAAAKEAFLETGRITGASLFTKAKSIFGVGEAELISGNLSPPYAPARFTQALDLCGRADPAGEDPYVQELRGDCLRRIGTVHRVLGRIDQAGASYAEAEKIYRNGIPRGIVWLQNEKAELLRARAFLSPPESANALLTGAAGAYDKARAASQRIRNINWYAHGLIGECELARIALVKFHKPLPKNLDTKYANAFEIYCQISSRWGIVQTFISQALLFHSAPEEFPDKYAATADKLEQAERFSKELGLMTEIALIKRIRKQEKTENELNPLRFL
jgi:hypothetical protein